MAEIAARVQLSDPTIDIRERIRRSLNERIASAYDQSRLPGQLNPEPDRQKRLLCATEIGYQLTPSKRHTFRHLAPPRPTITEHVQRVLGHDDLGKVLYAYARVRFHTGRFGAS